MSDSGEIEQVLALYDEGRVADQINYYGKRIAEYERSATQASVAAELLLVAAAICGILAAVQGETVIWFGIAAAALAATAGGIAAWSETVGFSANAELFNAARYGLTSTRPTRPEAADATPQAIDDYIDEVEGVLLGEVGAWGETWSTPTEGPSPI